MRNAGPTCPQQVFSGYLLGDSAPGAMRSCTGTYADAGVEVLGLGGREGQFSVGRVVTVAGQAQGSAR